MIPMDDGVSLAATLYVPEGMPPPDGWPAIVMFHGINSTRSSMTPIAEEFFAQNGYVVLAFDARAHGQSGGMFSLVGPRELADAAILTERWLPSHAPVNARRIGAFGISLGGGNVLRSTGEGTPFAAIVPVITWTELYSAIAPQGLAKSGAMVNFLLPLANRLAPEIVRVRDDAFAGRNHAFLREFARSRSSLHLLPRGFPPTFFIQGRRDFVFDIDQAVRGYRALRAPKRLYIGDLGHPPAANPPGERPHYLGQARRWFDRFLKGMPNGIDTEPPIAIARDPWNGTTASFRELPETRTLRFALRGRASIGASGKVVRTARLPRRELETFGAATVRVRASSPTGWRHLVAVLVARAPNGARTIVSEGGAATPLLSGRTRTVTIRLLSTATRIPHGSRLELTLAGTSTAQDPGNLLYLIGVRDGSRLRVRDVELRLPVLRRPISGTRAVPRRLADAPGITRSSILLGGTVPLTGVEIPYAGIARGAEAYFKYVNARGGVRGRKITYRYLDDAYDPGRTVLATRRLVQQDRVFAIFSSIGTEHNLAVRGYLNAAKVPQLFVGSGARAIGREYRRYPWTMGFLPSFVAEGKTFGRYIARTRPRARVAVVYESSEYGKELLAGLRVGLGRGGRAIVATQPHDVTDADVNSQIAKLKRSGADTLVVFALPKHMLLSFTAAAKLGWRPRILISSVSADPGWMRVVAASTSRAMTRGVVTIAFMKDPTDPAIARDPAVRLYKSLMRRYLPREDPGAVVHMYGMAAAHTMVEALRRAGRNPTRASLLRAATRLNLENPFLRRGIRVQTAPNDYFPISKTQFARYSGTGWRTFGGLVDVRD